MHKALSAVVVAAAALTVTGQAHAQWVWNSGTNLWDRTGFTSTPTITLQTAQQQGLTLRVGDKVFDAFTPPVATAQYDDSPDQATQDARDAAIEAAIQISGYFTGPNTPGILFTNTLWQVDESAGTPTIPTYLATSFDFRVTADPGWQIVGANMHVSGVIVQGSEALDDAVNITENVQDGPFPPGTDIIDPLVVQLPELPPDILSIATDTFSARQSVFITKDLILTTGNVDGGSVQVTALGQTFRQVPEPGTLALGGAGLALIAGCRRRGTVQTA